MFIPVFVDMPIPRFIGVGIVWGMCVGSWGLERGLLDVVDGEEVGGGCWVV